MFAKQPFIYRAFSILNFDLYVWGKVENMAERVEIDSCVRKPAQRVKAM